MNDIVKILIVAIFLMIAALGSRLNEVETQLSRIEKIGGLSDTTKN